MICRRLIGLPLAPVLATVSRSAAAAAAGGGVLALLWTDSGGLLDGVAGMVAGGIVFVAGLLLLGELTRAELRALARTLLTVRPGRTPV